MEPASPDQEGHFEPMGRLTELVLRHRRLIGLIWLIAVLIGGYASSVLSSHLSMSFEIPGTGSDIADSAIVARYGTGGSTSPLVPVVRLPAGQTVEQSQVRTALQAAFSAAATVGVRPGVGPSRGKQAQLTLVQPAAVQDVMLHYLPPGSQVRVTGLAPLTNAGGSASGPDVFNEILLGALGAMAVLAFVFASLLAVVALLIAEASVTTAFLAILG